MNSNYNWCVNRNKMWREKEKVTTMQERIAKIIKNWNIEVCEAAQIYDTAWKIGDKYVLKIYNDVNMLERNIKILTILGDMNIPIGRLIFTKENTAFAKDDQYYYILSAKLNGSHIVSLQQVPDIGVEMGRIIAKLHMAFKECENQDEFWDHSLLAEMQGWIRNTFCEDDWKYIEEKKFEETVEQLALLYDNLPVQLIHRDVHLGNFLFDEGKFSGYIDFDLSQRNVRIFDLCYFVLGLLSEEEQIDITNEEWFEIVRDVFDGYNQKIPLLADELKAIPYVMKSIELLFAAWFLGQNDMKRVGDAIKIFRFVDENMQKELLFK